MTLRHGHPSDLYSLYEICHRTGFGGQDASAEVSDRQLLGQYFAAPYLVRDPEWCWVAADEAGVAGYLVSTPDTRAFAGWMDEDWLPAVRRLFPLRQGATRSATETWIREILHQPVVVHDFVDDYPAHLHVDLLPRAQGQGLGSQFFEVFQNQLRDRGVPGFHLGVSEENLLARKFYTKLGLELIRHDPGVIFLGRRLG